MPKEPIFKDRVHLTVRLPAKLSKQLHKAAETRNISANSVIIQALEAHLIVQPVANPKARR